MKNKGKLYLLPLISFVLRLGLNKWPLFYMGISWGVEGDPMKTHEINGFFSVKEGLSERLANLVNRQ